MELQRLTLRRSTAVAPLLARLLSSEASCSRAECLALSAAATAAGSSAWAEVVSLEPQRQLEQPLPDAQQQAAQKQLSVSVHFFDSAAGPGSAPPSGGPSPGQLRCTVALGHVLLAHAPGFVANMLLLARQYQVGAAWQPGRAAAACGPLGSLAGGPSAVLAIPAATSAGAVPGAAPGEPTGQPSGGSDASSGAAPGTPSLLAQALQPHLLLECRVAQLQLLALSSQAPQAAALALQLRHLELRSGALSWEAPWNSRLRHALLAPPQGERVARRGATGCAGLLDSPDGHAW